MSSKQINRNIFVADEMYVWKTKQNTHIHKIRGLDKEWGDAIHICSSLESLHFLWDVCIYRHILVLSFIQAGVQLSTSSMMLLIRCLMYARRISITGHKQLAAECSRMVCLEREKNNERKEERKKNEPIIKW